MSGPAHPSPDTVPAGRPVLVFFAHERMDARVMKRIAALEACGWKVLGFTFHRERDRADIPPTWENVPLGTTRNRAYLQRAWCIVRAFGIVWRHRRRIGQAESLYAVNTDNALLALFARMVAPGRRPVALELADIQPAMTGQGLVPRMLRAVERFVLKRSALLVTTSPGFVRNYFTPVQGWTGRTFLLENKVYPSTALPAVTDRPSPTGRPWVIGCFGAFRCVRSLELMRTLALALPDTVRFYLRGYPAGTMDMAGFQRITGGLDNVEYGGAYQYPDDLADMYSRIDLNWCFDFSDPGSNSLWLLPNRIYEGGLFEVPGLASAGFETGRWLAALGIGWEVGEDLALNLEAFLRSLTVEQWQETQARYQAIPRGTFAGEADYRELSAELRTLEG